MEEPVTIIDRDVLKVLSVDTRLDILKMLSEGGRNPSFISQKLNKSEATIVEHLNVLMKAGLVKRIEQPGKKWIFYTLTDKGHGIIASKSKRLIIILVSSLVSFAGGIWSLFLYQTSQLTAADAVERGPFRIQGEPSVTPVDKITNVPIDSMFFYISLILLILATVGIGYFIYKKIQIKKRYHRIKTGMMENLAVA